MHGWPIRKNDVLITLVVHLFLPLATRGHIVQTPTRVLMKELRGIATWLTVHSLRWCCPQLRVCRARFTSVKPLLQSNRQNKAPVAPNCRMSRLEQLAASGPWLTEKRSAATRTVRVGRFCSNPLSSTKIGQRTVLL